MTAAYHHTGVFAIKNPTIESEVSWSSLLSFYTLEEQSFQHHTYIDGVSVGRHPLVQFLQGSQGLRPFRPARVPSWDLSIVLQGLSGHLFEPLETVTEKILTLKTILLLALSSL